MTAREPAIGRGAIVTACSILEGVRSNTELENILLEYGLSEYVPSRGSIAKTMGALKEFASHNPGHLVKTDFGEKPLAALVVDEAISRFGGSWRNVQLWDKLERYLNLDGYALLKEPTSGFGDVNIVGFTTAMPQIAELPESVSEVDKLLADYGFEVAVRHLSSAKENIAQADWEAANSQCRTFLEALTDAIADMLYPSEAASRRSGLQKRQLLAEGGFLSRKKHEFSDGSSHAFLSGLAKLLHPDGAHPGLSTQHDAMFRLQIVVVTARWLLKRIESENAHGALS